MLLWLKRHSSKGMKQVGLRVQRTVMINAVDEANSDLSVIVGHQDDVKQLFTVRVELPQARVDVHQGLCLLLAGTKRQMLPRNVQAWSYNTN